MALISSLVCALKGFSPRLHETRTVEKYPGMFLSRSGVPVVVLWRHRVWAMAVLISSYVAPTNTFGLSL